MKIILINPPAKNKYLRDQYCTSISKANYYWHPLDLLVQSGILSEKHEVEVIDAIATNTSKSKCIEMLLKAKPDAILFVTGFLSKDIDMMFIEEVSRGLECKIIASGGYLLYDYNKYLNEYKFIDAILLNYTSDVLIKYLDGDTDLYDLCVRKNNKIVSYSRSKTNVFKYPCPDYNMFPMENYKLPYYRTKSFASVTTSFGCPYNCDFCVARQISYKKRYLDNLFLELDYLKRKNITQLFFRDFTFGIDRQYTLALCEYLKENKFTWAASSRVDVLDFDLLDVMKKSGCHTLNFGVESPKLAQLERIKKNIEVTRITSVFSYCNQIGIKTLAHYIIGLPGDNVCDIEHLIEFSKNLKSTYASFNVAISLPKTAIEREQYDCLPKNEIIRLRRKAYKSFYLNRRFIKKYCKEQIENVSDILWAIKNFLVMFRKK